MPELATPPPRRARARDRGAHLHLPARRRGRPSPTSRSSSRPGEFALLAGRSACGKSTLLRAACGLVPHFHGGEIEGRIEVAGIDAIATGPGELAAAVGYVAQDPETQVVSTTVAAEIELPLEMRGDPPSVSRPRGRGGRPRSRDPAPARPHRRHPLRRRAPAGRPRRRSRHPPTPRPPRRAHLPARPGRRRRADLAPPPPQRGVGRDHPPRRAPPGALPGRRRPRHRHGLRLRSPSTAPPATSSPGPRPPTQPWRPPPPASSRCSASNPSRSASAMRAEPCALRTSALVGGGEADPLRTACTFSARSRPRPASSLSTEKVEDEGITPHPPTAARHSARDLWVELTPARTRPRRPARHRPDRRPRRTRRPDGPQRRRQEHAAEDRRRA